MFYGRLDHNDQIIISYLSGNTRRNCIRVILRGGESYRSKSVTMIPKSGGLFILFPENQPLP